jgi:hypothetical protein
VLMCTPLTCDMSHQIKTYQKDFSRIQNTDEIKMVPKNKKIIRESRK